MSSEPERDIEKQIRTYAEKRREEAGERFAMHPGSRQRLHDEVAEAFPREAPEPTPITVLHAEETVGFWTLFKRQFALVCVFAIVVTGLGIAWIKYGNQADVEVAQADPRTNPQDIVDEISAPLEIVDLSDGPEIETNATAAPNELPSSPRMTSIPSPPEPPPAVATGAVALVSSETASEPPSTATGSAPAAVPTPAPAPAAESLTTPDPNRPSQRFVNDSSPRKYRRNFNSPAPVDFLSSFQVQQVGRQLLLVDSDGSTFAGEIDPPDNGADSLKFRVSGSSRALNQQVTITGSLSPAGADAADAARRVNLRVASESRLPLDQLRIDARAIIGEESRPIAAAPVSGQ